jgi:hypothetical protein
VIHPLGSHAVAQRPKGRPGKPDPTKEIVEAFAQAHRTFFQAPELEDIVVARDNWLSKRRSNRRRPSRQEWWRTEQAH